MKSKIKLITLLFLSSLSLISCNKKAKLDTDIKKQSYALGQQIGSNLKNQKLEIDSEVFAISLKQVFEGKESQMTQEELNQAIDKLHNSLRTKEADTLTKNKQASIEFLEKNKKDSDVLVTASGLQYIVKKEGEGKSPKPQDIVKAHYKASVANGDVFDSSYERDLPSEFRVSSLLKGWSEGIQLMKTGGKIKLFLPPELGYGATARPGIPANSVLIIEIELIEIKK